MRQELATKQQIIDATIELIREQMDVNEITIRQIAQRAGVATSMINYHFQTKANLIDKAVQTFISTVISSADDQFKHMDLPPVEVVRERLKQAAGFMAANPGISRVSVLSDLRNAQPDDNSSQVLQSIVAQLRAVYGDTKDELDLKIKAQQMLATVHAVFLRASVFKEQTGIDYYDDHQRNELMDKIVDSILD